MKSNLSQEQETLCCQGCQTCSVYKMIIFYYFRKPFMIKSTPERNMNLVLQIDLRQKGNSYMTAKLAIRKS